VPICEVRDFSDLVMRILPAPRNTRNLRIPPEDLFLNKSFNSVAFLNSLAKLTLPYRIIPVLKVQIIWPYGASEHLNAALNELDLSFRSELHLDCAYKLRTAQTNTDKQTDCDGNKS
jgi:hypothetical protein